jgi:hypothetical protein
LKNVSIPLALGIGCSTFKDGELKDLLPSYGEGTVEGIIGIDDTDEGKIDTVGEVGLANIAGELREAILEPAVSLSKADGTFAEMLWDGDGTDTAFPLIDTPDDGIPADGALKAIKLDEAVPVLLSTGGIELGIMDW